MADIRMLSDEEIDAQIETATADLDGAQVFEERHRLAHWITRLRLEQERRLRTAEPRGPSSRWKGRSWRSTSANAKFMCRGGRSVPGRSRRSYRRKPLRSA